MYQDLMFEHDALNNCKCGSSAVLSIPNYADESTFVYCENECGEITCSYDMGCYEEGITSAINEWNSFS